MKKIVTLLIVSIMLSGCGAKGLDQLEACGECVKGLQELEVFQSLAPMLKDYQSVE